MAPITGGRGATSSTTTPPSDSLVGARFAIEELVARGGMGLVYRARAVHTGERVAVKLLGGAEWDHTERFAREAALLAELTHPAIVRYVAHGATASGTPYLVTEWLEGETLRERLERGGLDLAQSLALGLRVARALEVAHARGVVHRDLKPSNLFLPDGDAERVKLLDFGISQVPDAADLTVTGALLGTPGFMAPEQVRADGEVDARADVYALGCVLFLCIAGRPPFIEQTPFALILEINSKEAPRLSTVVPVPPALDALVARMLARDPRERPASAAEVARELVAMGSMQDEDTTDCRTRQLESRPSAPRVSDNGTILMKARPSGADAPLPPHSADATVQMDAVPEGFSIEPVPPTEPWPAARRGRSWKSWLCALALLMATLIAATGVYRYVNGRPAPAGSSGIARSSSTAPR